MGAVVKFSQGPIWHLVRAWDEGIAESLCGSKGLPVETRATEPHRMEICARCLHARRNGGRTVSP